MPLFITQMFAFLSQTKGNKIKATFSDTSVVIHDTTIPAINSNLAEIQLTFIITIKLAFSMKSTYR